MDRRILLLLAALLQLAACDGAAGDDTDAGADVGAEVGPDDGAGDAAPEGDAEPEDDAPGQDDAAADDAAPPCPPLTDDESGLILAGDADTAMDIVTNQTPEGDAFLHEPSACVDPADPTVQQLMARMRRTLAASFGGVGLAAPQVGVHRRIFLAQRTDQAGHPVQEFVNPAIVEYSPATANAMEGCLSVPGANPAVVRSLSVVIDYERADATPVAGETIGGARGTQEAYAARIVQHEYDHLDGILIVDPR